MTATNLVDRLAEHKTLGTAPKEELAWLASHGVLQHLGSGDLMTAAGAPVAGLFILLTGHVAIFVDRGAARHLIVWLTVDTGRLEPSETAALCALAPKGLAAAVLAAQPRLLGLAGGETVEDFAFMVVFASIVLTAIMIAAARLEPVRAQYARMRKAQGHGATA